MSVQSQIDRIAESVADAFSAVTAKGVSVPSGTKVDGLANLISSIVTGGKVTTEVYDITIASDLGQPTGNNSIHTLLTGNAFIKANVSKASFAVLLYPSVDIAGGSNIVHGVYHGNANIGSTGGARYGFCYLSTSATAISMIAMTVKVSGSSYNVSFRAKSTGNLDMYIANNRTLKAGSYTLVLMCWED